MPLSDSAESTGAPERHRAGVDGQKPPNVSMGFLGAPVAPSLRQAMYNGLCGDFCRGSRVLLKLSGDHMSLPLGFPAGLTSGLVPVAPIGTAGSTPRIGMHGGALRHPEVVPCPLGNHLHKAGWMEWPVEAFAIDPKQSRRPREFFRGPWWQRFPAACSKLLEPQLGVVALKEPQGLLIAIGRCLIATGAVEARAHVFGKLQGCPAVSLGSHEALVVLVGTAGGAGIRPWVNLFCLLCHALEREGPHMRSAREVLVVIQVRFVVFVVMASTKAVVASRVLTVAAQWFRSHMRFRKRSSMWLATALAASGDICFEKC